MTVVKAITIRRRHGGPNSRLIQTFIREGKVKIDVGIDSRAFHAGVFYYILISIANLINGISYLQPRQVISAINIPLSVMMAPILACRLVSFDATFCPFFAHSPQILDLRERGSETVNHSEGTGMAAFTTKSLTQHQSSPFTPPHHRSKSFHGRYSARHTHALDSNNIVLTTLGSSIHHDSTMSVDQDIVEMDGMQDDLHLPMGMDLGSLSTAIGGDDGEPIPDDSGVVDDASQRSIRPAPSYRNLEMGFRPTRAPSLSEAVRGIRVDVEKATATM